MSPLKSELEFEDLLEDIGDFGKYQKRLIFYFLVPSAALLPLFSMNILFMVFTPDHWCNVPEVAASNLSISMQRQLVAPEDNSSCFRYDLNYTEVLKNDRWKLNNDTLLVPCDRGWRYDQTHFDETAATKTSIIISLLLMISVFLWNMVCDKGHYSSMVMTLTNVGSIIGTPIYGTLSDKIGRKPVFFIVILVTAMTAISSVLMDNLTAFLVLRTINGSLMPSVFQLPFIILLEVVGPSMRTRMNGISNAAWTFGLCMMPVIAYFSKHWVTFGLATSSASVLMFFYWKFLPESPRWLISREKYAEAATVLTRISETNGKQQDPVELRLKIKKLGERIKKEKQTEASNTAIDFLRYPNLRKKFAIVTFCWVADMFAYYGLQINVPNLGGNPFINFFFLAFVEVPGLICSWYFMEKWGRRWSSVSFLILTGAACVLAAILPDSIPHVAVTCSLVGKFGASASFMAVYQQSSELYPTTVRSIGMGMSGTFAGLANIIVPYIIFLAVIAKYIPFLIIGVVCILAGMSAILLPETLDEILPQTIHDAEVFGRDQKCFSCSRRQRSLESLEEPSPKLLNDFAS